MTTLISGDIVGVVLLLALGPSSRAIIYQYHPQQSLLKIHIVFSQALATEAWMMYYAIAVTMLGTLGGSGIT